MMVLKVVSARILNNFIYPKSFDVCTSHWRLYVGQGHRCGSTKLLGTSRSWRVLFFGTDDFSVESLKLLWKQFSEGGLVSRLDVVTSLKAKVNPVRKFAEEHHLSVHGWPVAVKIGEFDIGLVVSFGHLIPEHLIAAFPLGMLNIHASLLPRWRGAAPIIHCIRSGDIETGVTIMQIQPHKFDVGGIVRQSRYHLSPQDDLPSVTKALSKLGAQLLMECLGELPLCLDGAVAQPLEGITYAPRVTAALSVVRWQELSAIEVYNLHRALVGVFPLSAKWYNLSVKLHNVSLNSHSKSLESKYASCRAGYVVYDRPRKLLIVKCCDGQWIGFGSIGVTGKKVMTSGDFYNGYISKQPEEERYFT